MDHSTLIAAGPSNIPPPVIVGSTSQRKGDGARKRAPKRKRIASEAGDGPGDGASGEVERTEVWTAPWLEKLGVTSYESKEQRLHDEIVAFFQYISPTPDESHARAMVIAQIGDVAKRRFAKGSVDTFGSVAQNLYLPDGDTDLVVNTNNPYDDETKKRALFQLAALMRQTGITPHVQVIHRARVPVISFTTRPELGSLKVDISLNATDGVRAVPILRDYFDKMPALRYLVICIKSLLSRHGLNTASSSGLSSYGVILLVISFLQLNPMNRPAECIEQPMESESLGTLLMDFLKYYGNHFDYARSVVSVKEGRLLTKKEKGWENSSLEGSMCIECLLNPENDVGRPTSKIGKIRGVFQQAHTALKEYAFSQDPFTHNVLGTILGVSEFTLAHRALLKEVVTSGRLTQALRAVQSSGSSYNGPRRPPQSQQHQRYHSRPYNNAGERTRSNLPPKPPPAQQQPPAGVHGLPPRPKVPYVPQGPSFGAMRAAANTKETHPNEKASTPQPPSSGKSPKGVRSPPRRRRKAE